VDQASTTNIQKEIKEECTNSSIKETKTAESPFQTFLKTLLSNPSKQKLFLEYFSAENGNKSYYLDTLTMVS
jgi:hypothetical protein